MLITTVIWTHQKFFEVQLYVACTGRKWVARLKNNIRNCDFKIIIVFNSGTLKGSLLKWDIIKL